ncbi:MAG TPA: hypothetical protein VHT04_08340 [Stellaceae bacterium]|jgi:hypothetical protein|nr:hypothetical protein [Stellaceae bacterium]
MIPRSTARLAVLALIVALAGCNTWQNRAEFAPPPDRGPGTQWPQDVLAADLPLGQQTSPIAATAPPPPIEVVHCYRTLAIVDCFTKVQPERYYGYTGSYPD